MLKSIRLTKFAAAGALGTPGDVSGAVKTAAFSYGFLTEVVDQRVSSGNGMSPAEDSTLDELDDSIKTASEITSLIREQTGALSKMASELGNAVKIDKETLRKAASDGAVDPNAILSGGRSFEQIKEASTKLSAVGEVMRITDYGSMSKMGKSLDLLGVTPDIATYIANGTPAGLTTGVLGLLDAA